MGFDLDNESRLEPPGHGPINETTVDAFVAQGIDCSTLADPRAAGEENEAAILYNVHLRQEHCQRLNQVLRMGHGLRLGPTSDGLSPTLRPAVPALPCSPVRFEDQQ
jgi:hypothetical protein